MYEEYRKILQNKSTRRFFVELLVVMTLLVAFLQFVVEPFLLSRFPSIFPSPWSPSGPPQAWMQDTRIGWFKLVLGALLLGPYMYYRIYRTDLGEDMLAVFDEER